MACFQEYSSTECGMDYTEKQVQFLYSLDNRRRYEKAEHTHSFELNIIKQLEQVNT